MSNLANRSAYKRITALVDENSFVEIGGMVTARNTDFNLLEKAEQSDGVITGYGVIDNSLVYVYSQDASVLGGTVGEMHAKKICRMYDMAIKMGAPVVALVDCAGMRLEEATDALNAFGEVYAKQVEASGIIPQVTAVFGTCGGGMGISAALSDFTFVAEGSRLFVNAPDTLDGNRTEKCDTASALYQAENGVADFVGTESQVLAGVRQLISVLPLNNDDFAEGDCTDDLNRVCENLENCVGDTAIALANIADSGIFFEMKKEYAKEMVTGFMKLNGITVGAVANRTTVYDEEMNVTETFEKVLTTAGCEKAADFVSFCDAFNIPVLTFTNTAGFLATVSQEKGIAKAAAKLTYAYAGATVPKINVIIGEAMGTAYNVMNSRACGADVVYAWPTAHIGTMAADKAVSIIYAEEIKNAQDKNTFIKEKENEYEALKTSVQSAAKRGYVDSIVEPEDTRKYVIAAFEMLYTKKEDSLAKKHGTV